MQCYCKTFTLLQQNIQKLQIPCLCLAPKTSFPTLSLSVSFQGRKSKVHKIAHSSEKRASAQALFPSPSLVLTRIKKQVQRIACGILRKCDFPTQFFCGAKCEFSGFLISFAVRFQKTSGRSSHGGVTGFAPPQCSS